MIRTTGTVTSSPVVMAIGTAEADTASTGTRVAVGLATATATVMLVAIPPAPMRGQALTPALTPAAWKRTTLALRMEICAAA